LSFVWNVLIRYSQFPKILVKSYDPHTEFTFVATEKRLLIGECTLY